jgi:hypothetical protein
MMPSRRLRRRLCFATVVATAMLWQGGADAAREREGHKDDESATATRVEQSSATSLAGHAGRQDNRIATGPIDEVVRSAAVHLHGLARLPVDAPIAAITVHVPAASLIAKAYGLDPATPHGQRAIAQQRLMGAAAVARLRQGGAFQRVDVREYTDDAAPGATDGLVLAARPFAFTFMRAGAPGAEFNPATQWDHYMTRPVSTYTDRLAAAGDSAGMFAYKVSR